MGKLILDDFHGGLSLPQNLKVYGGPNSLLQAKNIDYFSSEDGKIKIRGRRAVNRINTTVVQDPSAGNYIRNIYRHYRRNGNKTLLVAYETGSSSVKFKHDTNADGAFETITLTGGASATTNKRFHFANWPSQDKTYMCNGTNTTISGTPYGVLWYDPGSSPEIQGQSITRHRCRWPLFNRS